MDDLKKVSVTVASKDLPQVMNALLELLQRGRIIELSSGNTERVKPRMSKDTITAIKAFKEDV